MLRIPDRYRVLVVCCLWRGGVVSEIGDERLSIVDCSIKSNIVVFSVVKV